MRTVANVAAGRDNNFNLIRMLAACSVLVSHSYPLSCGPGTTEPLEPWTGESLGGLAVYVFFVVSGFFITSSFDRRRDVTSFVAARIVRLVPALFILLLFTVALCGPVFTELPLGQYLAGPRTWTYVPRNLSLKFLQYDLPGVFVGNHYPNVINGSLWTLYYEVVCYAMVMVVGLVGGLQRWRFALLLAIYVPIELMMVAHGQPSQLMKLSFPFIVGMAFYVFRQSIPLRAEVALALAGVAWAFKGTSYAFLAFSLFLGYVFMWLGCIRSAFLLAYNRFGDYSYGMYIYAFPVQQMVIALFPTLAPWQLTVMALPATLLLALGSWHLVEKRFLKRREELAVILRGIPSLLAPHCRLSPPSS